MRRFFIIWMFPFLISIGLVIAFRIFLLDIAIVSDNNMEYSLKSGDKIVFSKVFKPKRNKIVLINDFPAFNNAKIQRIIGLPGDSIRISNSLVYINNKRINEGKGIAYSYSFRTDSLKLAFKFLASNQIKYDKALARLGVFQIEADIDQLKLIKSIDAFKDIKRNIEEKNVNLSPVMASKHVIYWNKDHFGPILIPYKGLNLKLDYKSYFLYKELIENETASEFTIKSARFYLNNKPLESYRFKNDYYFLMNDKRSDAFDSRILGLVPENKIRAGFLLKLPW
jgi:signal peptidase I